MNDLKFRSETAGVVAFIDVKLPSNSHSRQRDRNRQRMAYKIINEKGFRKVIK